MSFLGGGGAPKAPELRRADPLPKPADIQPAQQQERARARRAGQGSTLLSRGVLSQEPSLFRPQLKGRLGG